MWQTVATWLVVGGVVIWFAAYWLKRRVFGRKGRGGNNEPPCCG